MRASGSVGTFGCADAAAIGRGQNSDRVSTAPRGFQDDMWSVLHFTVGTGPTAG